MQYLDAPQSPDIEHAQVICVALAHNEVVLIDEFLRHYRSIGVDHFLIVDDRSTDGTSDILASAPDVTVFTPKTGSTYKEHKRFWRAELLDSYCAGRWCVVPDIDEHLVFDGAEAGGLTRLAATLAAEGADAIQATMLDMYADAALDEVTFDNGPLIETFPFFDGPSFHHLLVPPRRFRQKYPTPYYMAIGGMRQRMFLPLDIYGSDWRARFFRKTSDIGRSFVPSPIERRNAVLARALVKGRLKRQKLFNMTKVPFLRWRKGLFFYNGAHALSEPMRLSRTKAVLLHFCTAAGRHGFEHKAARGEHAQGSAFYVQMLDSQAARAQSPLFEGSSRFTGVSGLNGFLSGRA